LITSKIINKSGTVSFLYFWDFWMEKEPFYLGENQMNNLKLVYGAPSNVPFIEDIRIPPSPESSFRKASEYVLKLKKNRFTAFPANQNYVHAARNKNMMQTQKSTVDESELYQQFWLTSDVVVTISKELRKIAFRDQVVQNKTCNYFVDRVKGLLRVMKHSDLIGESLQSGSKSTETMKYFIEEIRKIRFSILDNLIKNHELDVDKLPIPLKREFGYIITASPNKNKSPSKQYDPYVQIGENEMQKQIEVLTNNLPPPYRPSWVIPDDNYVNMFTKKIEERLTLPIDSIPTHANTVPVSPREKLVGFVEEKHSRPRILTRPSTRPPSPKQICNSESSTPSLPDVRHMDGLWKMSDPLKKSRTGFGLCPNDQFSSITNDLDVCLVEECHNNVCSLHIEDVAELTGEQPNIRNNKWTTSGNAPILFKEQRSMNRINNSSLLFQIESLSKQSNTIKFLMEQTPDVINSNDKNEVHEHLHSVWDSLGFSAVQKLEMLVKYTSDLDESHKLSEALSMWEHAKIVIERYNIAYRSLKDFLRLVYISNSANDLKYNELMANLNATEQSVMMMADQLKHSFGDELYFHRKRVVDIINERKEKIFRLRTRDT